MKQINNKMDGILSEMEKLNNQVDVIASGADYLNSRFASRQMESGRLTKMQGLVDKVHNNKKKKKNRGKGGEEAIKWRSEGSGRKWSGNTS
jgi:hypothetical protein